MPEHKEKTESNRIRFSHLPLDPFIEERSENRGEGTLFLPESYYAISENEPLKTQPHDRETQ